MFRTVPSACGSSQRIGQFFSYFFRKVLAAGELCAIIKQHAEQFVLLHKMNFQKAASVRRSVWVKAVIAFTFCLKCEYTVFVPAEQAVLQTDWLSLKG